MDIPRVCGVWCVVCVSRKTSLLRCLQMPQGKSSGGSGKGNKNARKDQRFAVAPPGMAPSRELRTCLFAYQRNTTLRSLVGWLVGWLAAAAAATLLSTDGIQITDFTMKIPLAEDKVEDVTLSAWDFAGTTRYLPSQPPTRSHIPPCRGVGTLRVPTAL
jgi:hypothetical protein